jgi:hypothetical protein
MNIYIPYTPRFLAVNMNLFLLTKEHQDWFEYDTNIASAYGSFAHCIWNGGRILSDDNMTLDLIENTIVMYNSLGIRFRLTFTNSHVTKEYLDNKFANDILDIASESGINEILVNNDILENYIKEKHQNKFEFIQSVTKCERNIDNINKACEKYKLVVIDYRDGRDDNFLNNIKNKDKAEIMLNDICNFYCKQRLEHHSDQQISILADGDIEKARELGYKGICCPYQIHYVGGLKFDKFGDYIKNDANGALTKERFKEVYNLGFRNFKIVGRDFDSTVLALTYAYYLSKEEYKQKFLDELLTTKLSVTLEKLEDYYMY